MKLGSDNKGISSTLTNMDFSLLKIPHYLHDRDIIIFLFQRQRKLNLTVGWNGTIRKLLQHCSTHSGGIMLKMLRTEGSSQGERWKLGNLEVTCEVDKSSGIYKEQFFSTFLS